MLKQHPMTTDERLASIVEIRASLAQGAGTVLIDELIATVRAERESRIASDECLILVADELERLGCGHDHPRQSTPPMFYPEWIRCVLRHKIAAERARAEKAEEALREKQRQQVIPAELESAIKTATNAAWQIMRTEYEQPAAQFEDLYEAIEAALQEAVEAERERCINIVSTLGYSGAFVAHSAITAIRGKETT